MDPIRAQRVAEALREELSEMIQYELDDPRIEGVQITEVQVSPDLLKARVRISTSEGSPEEILEALSGARSFLRHQIAERLQLRKTPDLLFEKAADVDPSRVPSLLRRIRRGRPRE